MDLDPEKIHAYLTEVGLQCTLSDLKNPTEEYVINLLTQFLNKFHIDLATIRKPTPEQSIAVSLAQDNPEIISLINLSEAMAGICSQIFLKDFFLTDITSPTPKKTRRLAHILSNFLLFALNKSSIIQEKLDVIRCELLRLDNLKREKNELSELKSKKASEISKKLARKEQLETEIARMRSLRDGRKAKIVEVQERLKTAKREKLDIAKLHGNLNAEASKVCKLCQDLESKLVTSPKRIRAHLQDLIEQKKNLTDRREVLEKALMSKKPAMEKIQKHLTVVTDAHAKFSEIIDAYMRLTDSKKLLEETKKQVSEISSLIEKEASMPREEDGQAGNATLQETKDQCEQHLSSVRNHLVKLLNDKKSIEEKLAADQIRQHQIFLENSDIRISIQKAEKDTEEFVAQCQELYDNEIGLQRKLKDSLDMEKR